MAFMVTLLPYSCVPCAVAAQSVCHPFCHLHSQLFRAAPSASPWWPYHTRSCQACPAPAACCAYIRIMSPTFGHRD